MMASTGSKQSPRDHTCTVETPNGQRDARGCQAKSSASRSTERPWMRKRKVLSHTWISVGKKHCSGDSSLRLAHLQRGKYTASDDNYSIDTAVLCSTVYYLLLGYMPTTLE
jgi:hypothetical protein